MSDFADRIKKIKDNWGVLASLSTWLTAIIGAFVIPLPYWGDDEAYSSQIKFTLFVAAVLSGMLVLISFKVLRPIIWWGLSLSFLVAMILSFFTYNNARNKMCLPYQGKQILIGHSITDVSEKKLEHLNKSIDDNDLLKYVGGDASRIWTKKSIDENRMYLQLWYSILYVVSSMFLISFLNLIAITNQKT